MSRCWAQASCQKAWAVVGPGVDWELHIHHCIACFVQIIIHCNSYYYYHVNNSLKLFIIIKIPLKFLENVYRFGKKQIKLTKWCVKIYDNL